MSLSLSFSLFPMPKDRRPIGRKGHPNQPYTTSFSLSSSPSPSPSPALSFSHLSLSLLLSLSNSQTSSPYRPSRTPHSTLYDIFLSLFVFLSLRPPHPHSLFSRCPPLSLFSHQSLSLSPPLPPLSLLSSLFSLLSSLFSLLSSLSLEAGPMCRVALLHPTQRLS